jgi:hypothetical protein
MSVSDNLDEVELTGIRRFFEAASRFPTRSTWESASLTSTLLPS